MAFYEGHGLRVDSRDPAASACRFDAGFRQVPAGTPHTAHDRIDPIAVPLCVLLAFQNQSDGPVAGNHALGISAERMGNTVRCQAIRAREREKGTDVSGQIHRAHERTVEAARLERPYRGLKGRHA
jgi:hypothetical protein